jgi:hypothetical protein
VDALNARVVCIHAPEAQIHHDLLGRRSGVLGQDRRLLQLPVQRVAVDVKVRALTIRPCLCVTATLTFMPNS